jgi:hypothetical protein
MRAAMWVYKSGESEEDHQPYPLIVAGFYILARIGIINKLEKFEGAVRGRRASASPYLKSDRVPGQR